MNRLKINYSTGELVSAKCIRIIKQKGCYWNSIGVYHEGHIILHPEEALYLIDQNNLLLLEDNKPLTVEACHLKLRKIIPPNHLKVYSNLKSAGFVVRRHQHIKSEKTKLNVDRTNLPLTPKVKDVKDLPHDLESDIYISYKNQCISDMPNRCHTFEDIKEKLPTSHNSNNVFIIDKINMPYVPITNPNIMVCHCTLPVISNLHISSHKNHKDDYKDGILSFNKYKYMINKLQIASDEFFDWSSYKKEYFNLYERVSLNDKIDTPISISNIEFNCKNYSNINLEDMLAIHYDIYKPNKKFSKSNPGIPDFFLHIVDSDPYTHIPDEIWIKISQFLKVYAKLGTLLIAYCDGDELQYISINDMPLIN